MAWLLPLVAVAAALWFMMRMIAYRRRVAKLRADGFFVIESFWGRGALPGIIDALVIDRIPGPAARLVERLWSNQYIHDQMTRAFLEKPERSLVAFASAFETTIATNSHELAVQATRADQTNIDKRVEAYRILEFFGPNIVSTRGDEWKRHRQVCTVAFTKSSLKLVRVSTVKNVGTMLEHWRGQHGGARDFTVELGGHDDMMRLTLSVFGESIFGRPMDVFTSNDKNQLATFCDSFLVANDSLVLWVVLPEWVYSLPIAKLRTMKRAFDNVRQSVMSLLDEAEVDDSKTDLLSLLARAGRKVVPLSRHESLSNVWMFSLAAMETSAHTLSWMLCRLAFHTDVQERLYAEAKEFVGRFTEVSPESAPYVYAVIHETLRLHPAVNVLPLMVRDGVTMEGHALETGWGFDISVECIHLNPAYFSDPLVYRPERFLEGGGADRSAFVAFSLGPRQCIGKQLALIEMAIALTMIVSSFRVAPLHPKDTCLQWRNIVTREFRKPLPFQFHSRTQ